MVHVAEAFGGGVAAAIGDYVRNTPGITHILAYTLRPDAPTDPEELRAFAATHQLTGSHFNRIRQLRSLVRGMGRVTVHAHSSFAGAYARLAFLRSGRLRIVYTPHCYAFERRDLGLAKRFAYRLVEWGLSTNTSAFAACSPREARLSRWPGYRGQVVYVPNVYAGPKPSRPRNSMQSPTLIRVVGAGRLAPQKDPEFFGDAIEALRERGFNISAQWIGDGPKPVREQLQDRGVQVLGWLGRREVLETLASGTVYVHTAAWEGFPIGLLEADAAGLPVVVRDAPWLEGVKLPGVIHRPADLVDSVRRLMSTSDRKVWLERQHSAFRTNSEMEQRRTLSLVYGAVTAGSRAARPLVAPLNEGAPR